MKADVGDILIRVVLAQEVVPAIDAALMLLSCALTVRGSRAAEAA